MSEKFSEQISQFIDDEMSSDECEFFVRRLQRDDAGRACYQRYQMIGSALRGEHRAFSSAFVRVDAVAHAGAGTSLADDASSRWWTSGITKAAVAAAVVLVAVVGWGMVNFGAVLSGNSASEPTTAGSMPDFEDILVDAEQAFPAEAEDTGFQYLIHHTGYSPGLPRTIMRSGFVAAPIRNASADAGVDPLD